jgi:hypothetical protein
LEADSSRAFPRSAAMVLRAALARRPTRGDGALAMVRLARSAGHRCSQSAGEDARFSTIKKLAGALGVQPAELVGDEPAA